MARNFRITSRRKGDALYFLLSGDFDGMSAMELIYALKEYSGSAGRIYIDTDGVLSLFPFGRDVFQKQFCFSPQVSGKLVFTGNCGRKLAPAGACCQ
jgi:hypothetical protein